MEVDNAIHGVEREIKQRFDLANTKCSVSRLENTMTLIADNNMKMEQVVELLRLYLAKRKVELGALDFGTPQNAGGGVLRETVSIKQGIDGDLGRLISKEVKRTKMKVQVTIQGQELRVSGKKKDDLQATMSLIKAMESQQPVQFVNYRE